MSYDTLTIEQGASVEGRFAPLSAKAGQAAKPAAAKDKDTDGQHGLSLAG